MKPLRALQLLKSQVPFTSSSFTSFVRGDPDFIAAHAARADIAGLVGEGPELSATLQQGLEMPAIREHLAGEHHHESS